MIEGNEFCWVNGVPGKRMGNGLADNFSWLLEVDKKVYEIYRKLVSNYVLSVKNDRYTGAFMERF
jgi:hypothetical protein